MPNISPSLLKDYIKDPYYMYRKNILKEIKFKETPAMLVGSMVDCYLTEGFEPFVEQYKAVDRRNLKNPPVGYTEVPKGDYDKAVRIASAVVGTEVYKKIIDDKYIAQDYLKFPYECGIFENLSGRPDWYKIKDGVCSIIDLKTTKSVLPEKFQWEIKDYEYYLQLCFYGILLKKLHPEIKSIKHYILAVENVDPNRVKLYELKHEEMFGQELRISGLLEEIKNIKEYKPARVSFDNVELI